MDIIKPAYSISAYGKGYNLATTGSIENIEIFNNFFANSANAAIYANSIKNLNLLVTFIY